ncbi:c-type cytochrome biogenesis protein CcmF [Betaproteobacteria bacterium]|nr:c-type cytochrome biogenesis protein CcmF [Betaproteobacteria bacterium]GHU16160.1 c-type cytochrome biogenesis protein CcmF [Betaproteobacteria bacterium]
MIVEFGHFALVLAAVMALVQAVAPLVGAARASYGLMVLARPAALAQFGCVVIAWGCLTDAFVRADFSVRLVANSAHSTTPLIYRITGVWGSHEGALLLWVLSLAAWTLAVCLGSRRLPLVFAARVIGVLGAVSTGFLVFMLATSNPFVRLLPAAGEGRDLNPLLQDPGMIIHPPLLYMGYVGFAVAFAFAIAALLGGRLDAAWARWARPWTTLAWVFLTAGIVLGSGWSYYELGWGGWWFWDPVENASFMPWLVGTALIHSLAVTEKRGAFRGWTVLLAIGAFSLSLLGTFLVRSGVVSSVHAFAADPARGSFILVLLVLVIGASLLLYAWRAPRLGGGGHFGLLSRETTLLGNNVLLLVVAASVLLGTLYPLALDALDLGKISVGPPYFEAVFVPLMAPVVVLMVVGPLLRWKGEAVRALRRFVPGAVMALVLGALGVLGVSRAAAVGWPGWRTALGLGLAAWVAVGCVQLLWERIKPPRVSLPPAAWWGMWLAHFGVGLFIVGATLVGSLQSSLDLRMRPGESADFAGYAVRLVQVDERSGPNYDALAATLDISRAGRPVAVLHPEKRFYRTIGMPMTEAAIDVGLFRDLYAALGEQLPGGDWIVSLHDKPFISWIWAGCAMMILGGLLAVVDRRYRRGGRRR